MREILIAFMTGCGTRLYALTGLRTAARGGGTPWFLVWELLPMVPLLGFVTAVVIASDPGSPMSRGFGWLCLGVAAVAGFAVAYAYRRRRTLAQSPTARLKGSVHGNVEIKGVARPLPRALALRAPLTGEVALWYRAERNRRRGLSEPWYVDRSEASDVPFIVHDGSGQCLVFPSALASSGAHEWRSRSGLEERVERWIAPGDTVFVVGELRTLERDQLPAMLSEHLPRGQTIRVLRAPRDGRPFLIGNRSERGEQLFYRAAGTVNLVFLMLALALGLLFLRYGPVG
jgi:hypothetical protein